MIAQVSGRLAAKQADRVVVHTAGGVGYEIAVPLGVMEQLPPVGETVSLATELVVREDGWALYGFRNEPERRFFQRRSEEHTSELQSQSNLVCRLLLEKKKQQLLY